MFGISYWLDVLQQLAPACRSTWTFVPSLWVACAPLRLRLRVHVAAGCVTAASVCPDRASSLHRCRIDSVKSATVGPARAAGYLHSAQCVSSCPDLPAAASHTVSNIIFHDPGNNGKQLPTSLETTRWARSRAHAPRWSRCRPRKSGRGSTPSCSAGPAPSGEAPLTSVVSRQLRY